MYYKIISSSIFYAFISILWQQTMLVKHYRKQISIYLAGNCAAHAVTTTKYFREKRHKVHEAQRFFLKHP